MTTLITGAGLIGASFARHAAERDEAVIFLDPFPRADYLKSMLGDSGYQVVEDDVRHLPVLVDILTSNQVDTIVHTAGRIGKRAADPLHEGYSLNIGGTQAVAEAVRLSGVGRLVHISTFGVYDWRRPAPEPAEEHGSPSSRNPGSTTACVRRVCRGCAPTTSLETSCFSDGMPRRRGRRI